MTAEDDRPVVYVYELGPLTKSYIFSGMHHTHLKLSAPFTIHVDLTEIDQL